MIKCIIRWSYRHDVPLRQCLLKLWPGLVHLPSLYLDFQSWCCCWLAMQSKITYSHGPVSSLKSSVSIARQEKKTFGELFSLLPPDLISYIIQLSAPAVPDILPHTATSKAIRREVWQVFLPALSREYNRQFLSLQGSTTKAIEVGDEIHIWNSSGWIEQVWQGMSTCGRGSTEWLSHHVQAMHYCMGKLSSVANMIGSR